MVGFVVTPGDIQDRDVAAPLLKVARKMFPSLARAIADGGYQGKATADAVRAEAKIPLEIVKRSDMAKGFVVLPKRWIVEWCPPLCWDLSSWVSFTLRLVGPRPRSRGRDRSTTTPALSVP